MNYLKFFRGPKHNFAQAENSSSPPKTQNSTIPQKCYLCDQYSREIARK